jgi:hypothetical protein
MLAFGFLALEREREERNPTRPGKKGNPPGDHGAGDPSRLAVTAGPDLSAQLSLLQMSIIIITVDVNRVVLTLFAQWSVAFHSK